LISGLETMKERFVDIATPDGPMDTFLTSAITASFPISIIARARFASNFAIPRDG
jgi:hypothetical protein